MWYLPIIDWLKLLYQSERIAAAMRWLIEHSTADGEVTHPSNARVCKHFNTVNQNFDDDCRNVYLGLCTYRFSPFGMSGRKYSLWPVIVMSYNLPPEMCMKREFLFIRFLVLALSIQNEPLLYSCSL